MRTRVRSFEDLLVWQKAHQIVLITYKLTRQFPKEEQYGKTYERRQHNPLVCGAVEDGCRPFSHRHRRRYGAGDYCAERIGVDDDRYAAGRVAF
ncbi:MAG TPA: hypothetical protein ENN97_06365 [Phycisphaerales bacterium]|nr:hypothetical protein [Phycisphaerales bacterium]